MTTSSPQGSQGVLVVDDDASIRALFLMTLSRLGLAGWEADGCAEAVSILQANPGKIAVALIDLHMPGTDGIGTLKALKQIQPDLRCCIVSGAVGPEDWILASGADCVLEKPFKLDALMTCLRGLGQGGP